MSNEAEYDVTSTQIFIPFKSIEYAMDFFIPVVALWFCPPFFHAPLSEKGMNFRYKMDEKDGF